MTMRYAIPKGGGEKVAHFRLLHKKKPSRLGGFIVIDNIPVRKIYRLHIALDTDIFSISICKRVMSKSADLHLGLIS